MPIKASYPDERPTLVLNFHRKVFDSRISFTRASTATYFGSDGLIKTAVSGQPRFDHDPTTGECKGLLIEEQRTNLLTYSEQFDNAAWTKNNATVTANSVTAPDGTTTADTLTNDSTTAFHEISLAATGVIGTQYAISVYAKQGTHTRIRLAGKISSNWSVFPNGIFDLSTGSVISSTGDKTATIENVGNGWYRCVIYGTCATATTIGAIYGPVPTGLTTGNFDGATYPGYIYIWGAQLEAGAFPTSYIPTTSAQATRVADVATMTGTNFSSWFNASEGTLVAESESMYISDTSTVFAISDGTNNNRVVSIAGLYYHLYIDSSAVNQANIDAGSYSNGAFSKIAAAIKANDFAASLSGGAVVADTSGTLPSVNKLNIGVGAQGNAGYLNGHIKRIAYYPKRLSNTELQALTT